MASFTWLSSAVLLGFCSYFLVNFFLATEVPGTPPGSQDFFLPSHLSDPHFLLQAPKATNPEKQKIPPRSAHWKLSLRRQGKEEPEVMPEGKALGFALGSGSRGSDTKCVSPWTSCCPSLGLSSTF